MFIKFSTLLTILGFYYVNCAVRINKLVKVYGPNLVQVWGKTWPEGIRLVNNLQASVSDPGISKSFQKKETSTRKIPLTPRRTYTWQNDDLIISFNMTALADPLCTRLVPPISWILGSGASVRIFENGRLSSENSEALTSSAKATESSKFSSSNILERFIEITVPRERIENTMTCLRMQGFAKEDIYRMLDKGPWVLAFNVNRVIPKIFSDLQTDLNLNSTQAVHILSHCPYLIAQYSKYKGRDVFATASALLDIGFTKSQLLEDSMRFPSMLSAPPDRIRGWQALLESFGIATEEPSLFGKLIRKAPYMFYVNPPLIFDNDDSNHNHHNNNHKKTVIEEDVSVTASGFISFESLRVLETFRAFNLSSKTTDRLVRSFPRLLLDNSEHLKQRLQFLYNLLLEYPSPASLLSSTSTSIPLSTSTSQAVLTFDGDIPVPQVQFQRQVEEVISEDILKMKKIKQINIKGISSLTSSSDSSASSTASTSSFVDSFVRDVDSNSNHEQEADVEVHSRASVMLNTILYSYPAIINNEASQMRAVSYVLRGCGLRRTDVVQLIRRHPPIISKEPVALRSLLEFLKEHCGLRKGDLVPLITRYPAVLGGTARAMQPQVDYLYESLGGTPEMLRRTPSYLSFSLDEYIRPRAEFLRAFNVDPLCNGLQYLINATPQELSYLAGAKPEIFNQFRQVFSDRWKTRSDETAQNMKR
eukprot:gene3297-6531_t